jgi:hypothetical protein
MAPKLGSTIGNPAHQGEKLFACSPRRGRFALLYAFVCLVACAAFAPSPASAAGTASIAGTVEDAQSGNPIPGAKVCAYPVDDQGAITCAEADASGEYAIEGLEEREYAVEFTGEVCIGPGTCSRPYNTRFWEDKVPFEEPTPILLTEGERTFGIDAELEELGSISGTVEDAAGNPIDNTVVCENSDSEYHPGCAFTDASGEYTLYSLPPGEFNVEFTGRTCQAGSTCDLEECHEGLACPRPYVSQFWNDAVNEEAATIITVPADTEVPHIDATLVAGGSITGQVTLAALGEEVLAGIVVCASPVSAPVNGSCGRTDAVGQYTIEGLATADYYVRFAEFCEEEPCPNRYVTQYYENVAAEEDGTPVPVTVGDVVPNINARIAENAAAPPVFSDGLKVSGAATVGSSLECDPGNAGGHPTAVSVVWHRDGVDIPGQTGLEYTVTNADEGTGVSCSMTLTNSAGSTSADSAAVQIPAHTEEPKPSGGGSSNTAPTTTAPAPAPPPPAAKKEGVASVGSAKVKGKVVNLAVRCNGETTCKGPLKLIYEEKTKTAKGKTKVKKVTVASVTFSLAPGATRTVAAKLTVAGTALLAEAGKSGLKVKVTGASVKPRSLTLTA